MTEIEKTEKDKKAEAKILDAKDESFCGFISLGIVDQDGYGRVTKGNNVSAPLFLSRKDGKVVLEAQWTPNPLYFLQLQRDAQLYLTGDLWFGEAKMTPLNSIGKVIPKSCEQLITTMEKCKQEEFTMKVEIPFLGNSPQRLAPLTVVTKEERFITKVILVKLELSEADWNEWKEYRIKFWRSSKAWGGSGGEDEKKDKDEDKDKKDKESNKV